MSFLSTHPKSTTNVSNIKDCIYHTRPDTSYSSVPWSFRIQIKTHQWATFDAFRDTSVINMNTHTHTVVYLDSELHSLPRCPKYSLMRQMWIYPLLKLILSKCTFSPVWAVCCHTVLENVWAIQKTENTFLSHLQRFPSSVKTKGLGTSCYRRQRGEPQ